MILAVCFFAFILWVIYLANHGRPSLFFEFVQSFPNGDKLGHFCLFGTLTLLSIVATKFKSFPLGKLNIYYGFLLVALFVLSEELSQAFISTRTFDLIDLSADAAGILVSTCLAKAVEKRLNKMGKLGK
jgi:VanZ family protein